MQAQYRTRPRPRGSDLMADTPVNGVKAHPADPFADPLFDPCSDSGLDPVVDAEVCYGVVGVFMFMLLTLP